MAHLNFVRGVAHPWDRGARKIESIVVEIEDRLHDVWVHDVRGRFDWRGHRGNGCGWLFEQGVHGGVDGTGSSSGSSPCTFTKTLPFSWAATSATRSVPVRWSERVMRAVPPKLSTAFTMRSSSVATITRSASVAILARS